MSRLTVTGASGLLGSNFVLTALEQNYEVMALCYPQALNFPGAQVTVLDLTNKDALTENLHTYRPDWIVHCAAMTNVDACETHPDEAWQVNVEVTRCLARLARQCDAGIVYISTDSVFDGKNGGYDEDSAVAPCNVYAKTKHAGELAVQGTACHSIVARTNIYGWNPSPKKSLAEWMLERLETGQSLPGFEDVMFAPILVNDLSETILNMIRQGLAGTYHVNGSQACSKYQFACDIAAQFGLDVKLVFRAAVAESVLQAPRPRNTWLRTDKISQALGHPMPNVTEGLMRFKQLRNSGYTTNLKSLAEV